MLYGKFIKYVKFNGMVYQHVISDSYEHKLCCTYNELIFFIVDVVVQGFCLTFTNYKWFDLIDKFKDTSGGGVNLP